MCGILIQLVLGSYEERSLWLFDAEFIKSGVALSEFLMFLGVWLQDRHIG